MIDLEDQRQQPHQVCKSTVFPAHESQQMDYGRQKFADRPSRSRQRYENIFHSPLHQQQLEQIKTQYLSHQHDITIDRETVLKINRLATRRNLAKREHSWPPTCVQDEINKSVSSTQGRSLENQHVRSSSTENSLQFDEHVCRRHVIDNIREKFNSPSRIIESSTADARNRPSNYYHSRDLHCFKKKENQVNQSSQILQTDFGQGNIDSNKPKTNSQECDTKNSILDDDDDEHKITRVDEATEKHDKLKEEVRYNKPLPTTKILLHPETKAADMNLGLVDPRRQFYEQLTPPKKWSSCENINSSSKYIRPNAKHCSYHHPNRQSNSLDRGKESKVLRQKLPPLKPRSSEALLKPQKLQRRSIKMATEIKICYDADAEDHEFQDKQSNELTNDSTFEDLENVPLPNLPSECKSHEAKENILELEISDTTKHPQNADTDIPSNANQTTHVEAKMFDDSCIFLRSIDLQDNTVAFIPAAITIVPSPTEDVIQHWMEHPGLKASIKETNDISQMKKKSDPVPKNDIEIFRISPRISNKSKDANKQENIRIRNKSSGNEQETNTQAECKQPSSQPNGKSDSKIKSMHQTKPQTAHHDDNNSQVSSSTAITSTTTDQNNIIIDENKTGKYYTDGEYLYGPYDPSNSYINIQPLHSKYQLNMQQIKGETAQQRLRTSEQRFQSKIDGGIEKDTEAETIKKSMYKSGIADLTAKYEYIQKSISEHLRHIDAYIENAKAALKSAIKEPGKDVQLDEDEEAVNKQQRHHRHLQSTQHSLQPQTENVQTTLLTDKLKEIPNINLYPTQETPLQEILRRVSIIMQDEIPESQNQTQSMPLEKESNNQFPSLSSSENTEAVDKALNDLNMVTTYLKQCDEEAIKLPPLTKHEQFDKDGQNRPFNDNLPKISFETRPTMQNVTYVTIADDEGVETKFPSAEQQMNDKSTDLISSISTSEIHPTHSFPQSSQQNMHEVHDAVANYDQLLVKASTEVSYDHKPFNIKASNKTCSNESSKDDQKNFISKRKRTKQDVPVKQVANEHDKTAVLPSLQANDLLQKEQSISHISRKYETAELRVVNNVEETKLIDATSAKPFPCPTKYERSKGEINRPPVDEPNVELIQSKKDLDTEKLLLQSLCNESPQETIPDTLTDKKRHSKDRELHRLSLKIYKNKNNNQGKLNKVQKISNVQHFSNEQPTSFVLVHNNKDVQSEDDDSQNKKDKKQQSCKVQHSTTQETLENLKKSKSGVLTIGSSITGGYVEMQSTHAQKPRLKRPQPSLHHQEQRTTGRQYPASLIEPQTPSNRRPTSPFTLQTDKSEEKQKRPTLGTIKSKAKPAGHDELMHAIRKYPKSLIQPHATSCPPTPPHGVKTVDIKQPHKRSQSISPYQNQKSSHMCCVVPAAEQLRQTGAALTFDPNEVEFVKTSSRAYRSQAPSPHRSIEAHGCACPSLLVELHSEDPSNDAFKKAAASIFTHLEHQEKARGCQTSSTSTPPTSAYKRDETTTICSTVIDLKEQSNIPDSLTKCGMQLTSDEIDKLPTQPLITFCEGKNETNENSSKRSKNTENFISMSVYHAAGQTSRNLEKVADENEYVTRENVTALNSSIGPCTVSEGAGSSAKASTAKIKSSPEASYGQREGSECKEVMMTIPTPSYNRSFDNISPRPYIAMEGYKRVAWPPASEERIVREFTPQPQPGHYPVEATSIKQQQSTNPSDVPGAQQGPHQQHQQSSPSYFKDNTATYNHARESNPFNSQNDDRESSHMNFPEQSIEKPIVLVDRQFSRQPYWQQNEYPETQSPGYTQKPIYQQQYRNPSHEPQKQMPYQQQESHYAPSSNHEEWNRGCRSHQPMQQGPNALQQQQQHYCNNNPTMEYQPHMQQNYVNAPHQQNQQAPSQHMQQNYVSPHHQNPVPPQHMQQNYVNPHHQNQVPSQTQYQQPDNQFQQPRWVPQQQHLPQPYKSPNQQDQYQAHQHLPQPYKAPNQQDQQQPQHTQQYQAPAPYYQSQHQQYQPNQSDYSLNNQQQVPHHQHHQALSNNQFGSQPNQAYNSFSQPQHPNTVSHDQTDKLIQDHYNEQRGGSPGIITLRKEAPVSQAAAPVYASQPAAVSYQGGSKLRGDLKWPPPECKDAMAKENEERRQLALGPVCRPRKINRDYSPFFAKNALSHHYPSYKNANFSNVDENNNSTILSNIKSNKRNQPQSPQQIQCSSYHPEDLSQQQEQPYVSNTISDDQTDTLFQALCDEQSNPDIASPMVYQRGGRLKGDLKWPPPEWKDAMAREEEERCQLALGQPLRHTRVKRDYSTFFAKNAISHHYPRYKAQKPLAESLDQADQAYHNEQNEDTPESLITLGCVGESYKGSGKLSGDLIWPPPECKEAIALENEKLRQLALGPLYRPRRVQRDFTAFFAKNALSQHYPSYKVPPGTHRI